MVLRLRVDSEMGHTDPYTRKPSKWWWWAVRLICIFMCFAYLLLLLPHFKEVRSCCSSQSSVFPIRSSAATFQLRDHWQDINWLGALCLTLVMMAGETLLVESDDQLLSPALCSKTDWYYIFTTDMSSPTEVRGLMKGGQKM